MIDSLYFPPGQAPNPLLTSISSTYQKINSLSSFPGIWGRLVVIWQEAFELQVMGSCSSPQCQELAINESVVNPC